MGVAPVQIFDSAQSVVLAKRLRVAALEEVDGLWTTTRILIHAGEGRSSSLALQCIKLEGERANEELFRPESLADMAVRLAPIYRSSLEGIYPAAS